MNTETIIGAIDALKEGRAVAFPTDTVYGLGVAVMHADSLKEIYDLKQRDANKLVAWLVGGPEALDEYGVDVPEKARRMAEDYWPGALTIVVKASDAVPEAFRPADGTIGLRMPASDVALRLIRVVGPIATSSANVADGKETITADDLDPQLAGKVAAVVPGGFLASGVASTVVDCSHGSVNIVRQGGVTLDGVPTLPGEKTSRAVFTEIDKESWLGDAFEDEDMDAGEAEAEAEDAESDDGANGDAEADDLSEIGPYGQNPQAETNPWENVGVFIADDDSTFTVPIEYVSHDQDTDINAKLWTNAKYGNTDDPGAERPKAVIQIVHGMAEYIDRYDELARYFVSRGFIVCAEDHVGHGGSIRNRRDYGHIPGHGGKEIVIGDVHTLHSMVARAFPDIPYVLYGHSMGSFITRAYIARYGDELNACVLSGTGNVEARLSKAGNALARFIASIKGDRYRSKLIDNMGAGAYGKKIPNARTPLDWLSTDENVVDAYIADDKCGFMFTVGGYATLLDLTAEIVTPECASQVPVDLPILLAAGDGDPVGDMGEGVKAAAQLLRDAGVRTVDEIIYPGMRHEIHNEIGKARVYDDIATWIENHV